MEPQVQMPQAEFLWRRFLEAPPTWALWFPVGFAFLIIALLALFRDRGWSRLVPATIVVAILSAIYVVAGYNLFLGLFSWWYLLGPTMAIALVYVVLMYRKDSHSVHPAIAACLGLLRCSVYAILATVFLLPGCQTFEKSEYRSKVLILYDVSDSMRTRDDIPLLNQDPNALPTRQQKVHRVLAGGDPTRDTKPLLDLILAKSPANLYRFGAQLDESEVFALKQGEAVPADALAVWQNPDRKNFSAPDGLPDEERLKRQLRYNEQVETLKSGTNIYGSALQMAKIEGNNNLQAIIVISDGGQNLGSEEAKRDLENRTSGNKKVKVFTIGVGEYRNPASIKVDDVQAPESARPDDQFPVRVQVVGSGLAGEEFDVTLTATRVKDGTGQPVQGEATYNLGTKKAKFEGGGDYPQGTVEFPVDVQDLKNIKVGSDKEADLEGTWQFVAKVPRNQREAQFTKPEHVTDPPVEVLVMKRKLRVLLFAGGPTREYQFLRTLLYREVLEKRLDLSVYLQSGKEDLVDQDVESERLLRDFPNKLGADDPSAKYMSLSDYDVIIAIDPEWIGNGSVKGLDPAQMKLLREWVSIHSGGLVFVAGPVSTFQLARPAGVDITDLRTLLPVFLNDSRLHGVTGIGHDTSRPYTLRFTPSAKLKDYDFLRLDENDEDVNTAWNRFYWGAGEPGDPATEKPKRGFYNYYPVDKVKTGATVLATFVGPEGSRINDGKEEQPFIVTMPVGNGKTMFLGSGEFNRLRQTKAAYHERFWIKLARFMSAGTTQQKKYGRFMMPRSAPIGNVQFEVQLKGKDLLPLAADLKPSVYVKRLDAPAEGPRKDDSLDLKAKTSGDGWAGWFAGTFKAREKGEYEFRVPIPDTDEFLTQRLSIRPANPELDNVRNNFGLLHQLAGDANEALSGLPAETRRKVLRVLQAGADEAGTGAKDKARLFFKLQDAGLIADCLTVIPPREVLVKGKLFDMWDRGWESNRAASAFFLALLTPLAIGALGGLILLILRQYLFGSLFFLAGVVMAAGVFGFDLMFHPEWANLPLDFSFVLAAVVTLLGLEWLTRKLLKLA
jgi:hypothetical protein